MYPLRRAALRAVLIQPSRHISATRPLNTRLSISQSSKPTIYRAFHQSRISRAAEDETKVVTEELANEAVEQAEVASTAAETAQVAEEVVDGAESANQAAEATELADEAAEEAIGAAEVADAAAEEANAPRAGRYEAGELAAAAAESASFAAGAAATSARNASARPRAPRDGAVSFPPRTATGIPDPRILYIGNLFFEVTADSLQAHFAKFGNITNARIVTDPRGLSKGFGYLEFESPADAEEAIKQMDQSVFEGRRMMVQPHQARDRQRPSAASSVFDTTPRAPHPPSKTLFIGNLSFQMSDRDLNDLFRNIRDVLDVRVAIDRRTGQPRGFAHADFIDIQAAQKAKEVLERETVYGRALKVDYSASRARRFQDGPQE